MRGCGVLLQRIAYNIDIISRYRYRLRLRLITNNIDTSGIVGSPGALA